MLDYEKDAVGQLWYDGLLIIWIGARVEEYDVVKYDWLDILVCYFVRK